MRATVPFGQYYVDQARSLVGETIVFVTPTGRDEQDIERSDRSVIRARTPPFWLLQL